jgi:NAD(P)-dependent dehydrogenase (short-subunit alcohol dehydrogenase family)
MLSKRHETEDGNETTLQVNHLSPFLLTVSLRDALVAAERARVINVTSTMHRQARHGVDFDDLQSTRGYRGSTVYSTSKLMNILFTRELARRWDSVEVGVNAAHPGFVASGFGKDGDTRGYERIALVVLRPFAMSPEKGARTQVYLASAPEVSGLTGGYWEKCAPVSPSDQAQDDDAARRLWEVSERLVA